MYDVIYVKNCIHRIAGRIFIKPLTEVDYVEGSVCYGTGAEIFVWTVQFVLKCFFFFFLNFFKPRVGIAFPIKANFLKMTESKS